MFKKSIEQIVRDILALVIVLKYKRIRALREDHDYTQSEVGKKLMSRKGRMRIMKAASGWCHRMFCRRWQTFTMSVWITF